MTNQPRVTDMTRLKPIDLPNYRPDPPTAEAYERIPEAAKRESLRKKALREQAFAAGLYPFTGEQLRVMKYETGLTGRIEKDLLRWQGTAIGGAWVGALSDALGEFPDAVDFDAAWNSYRAYMDMWTARRAYWQRQMLARMGRPN